MKIKELSSLVAISHFYGQNKEYVIAGGGNTSFKNEDHIWVKASGTSLGSIQEEGFVCLSRNALKVIREKEYSTDSLKREEEVKQDLAAAIVSPANLRPSVETSLHDIIESDFVVHTHPTYVNALMCSKDAEAMTKDIFGDEVIFVEYTDPGFILFKKVVESLDVYKERMGSTPSVIFLQNHGVFVASDTLDEIKIIYRDIEKKIKAKITNGHIDQSLTAFSSKETKSIQKILQDNSLKVQAFTGEIIRHIVEDPSKLQKITDPFTPDIIVYCKSSYLILEKGMDPDIISKEIESFRKKQGYFPKVILIRNSCLVIVEESPNAIQTCAEVFFDMMKISLLAENFGGPHPMTQEQIMFIDNWEVENYRRKISKSAAG